MRGDTWVVVWRGDDIQMPIRCVFEERADEVFLLVFQDEHGRELYREEVGGWPAACRRAEALRLKYSREPPAAAA